MEVQEKTEGNPLKKVAQAAEHEGAGQKSRVAGRERNPTHPTMLMRPALASVSKPKICP